MGVGRDNGVAGPKETGGNWGGDPIYEAVCAREAHISATRYRSRPQQPRFGRTRAFGSYAAMSGAGHRHDRLAAAAEASSGKAVLRREGDCWRVGFQQQETFVRDSKGLGYLAVLVSRPHREIHVLDLVAPAASSVVPFHAAGMVRRRLGDAGLMLDERAKVAYQRRLAELEIDLDEARACNDTGRVEWLEAENEALVRELAAAVGLRGRDRRVASVDERARVAVTKAIRAAIARLRQACPCLGAHFEATVRTGLYCRYAPDPDETPTWRVWPSSLPHGAIAPDVAPASTSQDSDPSQVPYQDRTLPS